MTSFYARFEPTHATVAQVATLNWPGDVAIVAGTAEFSLADLVHRDAIASSFHLDTEIDVTYGALVADSMEPVRVDDRRHFLGFGFFIDNDIGIFRPYGRPGR